MGIVTPVVVDKASWVHINATRGTVGRPEHVSVFRQDVVDGVADRCRHNGLGHCGGGSDRGRQSRQQFADLQDRVALKIGCIDRLDQDQTAHVVGCLSKVLQNGAASAALQTAKAKLLEIIQIIYQMDRAVAKIALAIKQIEWQATVGKELLNNGTIFW